MGRAALVFLILGSLALGFMFGISAAYKGNGDLDKESYAEGFAAGWCSYENPDGSPPNPSTEWVDCHDGVMDAHHAYQEME